MGLNNTSPPHAKAKVPNVAEILKRRIIFVSGKGGVGKSVIAEAVALALSSNGRRTLWIEIEDPLQTPGEIKKVGPRLWHLNCEAQLAFEEYATLKIGDSPLAKLFIENKLMRYLSKAAPGIHELVLLGKIWHERTHYDAIVVDMPSTGHGLAMFQCTQNFSTLFQGGPTHADAKAMVKTFGDPKITGHLIVAFPEEMPLQEGLELDQLLRGMFPANPAGFVANRIFPRDQRAHDESPTPDPTQWLSPVAKDTADYIQKRRVLEAFNLKLWKERAIPFLELDFIPPTEHGTRTTIAQALALKIVEVGLV